MWTKKTVVGAVLLGLIIVTAVGIFAPGEPVTRLIAVGSFFLTAGKVAYDVWVKHREARERIEAFVTLKSLDNTEILGVELYNAGNSPILIKRVQFVSQANDETVTEFLACESEADRLENCIFQEASTLPESVSRLEIGPKGVGRFFLDRHTDFTAGRILELPAKTFSIVVESFTGEVARISGKELQDGLGATPYGKAVVGVMRKLEEYRMPQL